jgi:hypothetical protein
MSVLTVSWVLTAASVPNVTFPLVVVLLDFSNLHKPANTKCANFFKDRKQEGIPMMMHFLTIIGSAHL